MSGSSGLYLGFCKAWEIPTYIGIFNEAFSPKKLPKEKVDEKSYWYASYFCLAVRLCSIEPKPKVLKLPERFTFAKSANLKFKRPLAANPPLSSKSVKRNSFNQISPHLEDPSSSLLEFGPPFLGFLTPNIIVLIILILGFPTIVICLSEPEKGSVEPVWIPSLIDLYLSCLAASNCSNEIFNSFSIGHMIWSSFLETPHGVTFRGISYS